MLVTKQKYQSDEYSEESKCDGPYIPLHIHLNRQSFH